VSGRTLLIDNDAFVLFAGIGWLEPAVKSIGFELTQCLRIDALPHMLRKRKSFKAYPVEMQDRALASCNLVAALTERPRAELLDPLVGCGGIDPTDAILFAMLAQEPDWWLLTGDKRAMRGLAAEPSVAHIKQMIQGRVSCVETVFDRLVRLNGSQISADAFRPLRNIQNTVAVVFSDGHAADHAGCLAAIQYYIDDLEGDVGTDFFVKRSSK
jgi:hypothetical protein